jgi:hypothetical protein
VEERPEDGFGGVVGRRGAWRGGGLRRPAAAAPCEERGSGEEDAAARQAARSIWLG